jgi:hypothetical protein
VEGATSHQISKSGALCEHDGNWYTYNLSWSDRIYYSQNFKEPGHDNPTVMPVTSAMTIAKDVKLGQFALTASQILSVGKYEKLEVTVELFK